MKMNTNTFTWHASWTLFDFMLLMIVVVEWMQHQLLFGSALITTFVMGFMTYRTVYHAVLTWKLR